MGLLILLSLYVLASVFAIVVIFGTKHDLGFESHPPYFIAITERRSLFTNSVFTIHVYVQGSDKRVHIIKGDNYKEAYEMFLKFKDQG